MPPRPIYRWKSFWLGVLTLGFLCGAWVRARGHCDTMRVAFLDSYWYLESWGEYFDIERNSLASHGWLPGFDINSDEARRSEPEGFPPAIERFNRGLKLRQEAEEASSEGDPFADPDPEKAAAERKEMAAQQIEISDYMTWRFAWWFVVVMFLVPWALFLAWRWHRMRRISSTSA